MVTRYIILGLALCGKPEEVATCSRVDSRLGYGHKYTHPKRTRH